jgi:hypothetical protein
LKPLRTAANLARGLAGWGMVWSVPFVVFWIWTRTGLDDGARFRWTVCVPVLPIAGHLLTGNTPVATDAGVRRRKQRVEASKSAWPDRFWMFVMNLFAGVALADVVGLLLIHHVPALRELEPKSIGWSRIIVQIAFPASLALGAWHRTRWGWCPERLERAVEPKVPLVGRTAADIGFKICVALLLMILSAAIVQFVQAGTDPNMLFR